MTGRDMSVRCSSVFPTRVQQSRRPAGKAESTFMASAAFGRRRTHIMCPLFVNGGREVAEKEIVPPILRPHREAHEVEFVPRCVVARRACLVVARCWRATASTRRVSAMSTVVGIRVLRVMQMKHQLLRTRGCTTPLMGRTVHTTDI